MDEVQLPRRREEHACRKRKTVQQDLSLGLIDSKQPSAVRLKQTFGASRVVASGKLQHVHPPVGVKANVYRGRQAGYDGSRAVRSNPYDAARSRFVGQVSEQRHVKVSFGTNSDSRRHGIVSPLEYDFRHAGGRYRIDGVGSAVYNVKQIGVGGVGERKGVGEDGRRRGPTPTVGNDAARRLAD